MRRLLGFVLLIIVIGFGLSFALLNADSVHLDYYLGTVNIPLSLALALAFALGAFFGVLAVSGVLLRQRRDLALRTRRLGQCEQELDELRKLPLKDPA